MLSKSRDTSGTQVQVHMPRPVGSAALSAALRCAADEHPVRVRICPVAKQGIAVTRESTDEGERGIRLDRTETEREGCSI